PWLLTTGRDFPTATHPVSVLALYAVGSSVGSAGVPLVPPSDWSHARKRKLENPWNPFFGRKRSRVDGLSDNNSAAVAETVVGTFCHEAPPFTLNCQRPFLLSMAVIAIPCGSPSTSITSRTRSATGDPGGFVGAGFLGIAAIIRIGAVSRIGASG